MRTDIPADLEKTQGPPRPGDFDGNRARDEFEKLIAEQRMMQAQAQAQVSGCAGQAPDPLDDFFRYHPPTPEDLPKYAAINQAAKNFAEVLRANCPDCADYRDAIRKLREARMIANAAVALRGRGF